MPINVHILCTYIHVNAYTHAYMNENMLKHIYMHTKTNIRIYFKRVGLMNQEKISKSSNVGWLKQRHRIALYRLLPEVSFLLIWDLGEYEESPMLPFLLKEEISFEKQPPIS